MRKEANPAYIITYFIRQGKQLNVNQLKAYILSKLEYWK